MKWFVLAILIVFGLVSCVRKIQSEGKSRVIEFNYDGLGDDMRATIEGSVYESEDLTDSGNKLRPLKNVRISVEQIDSVIFTNRKGDFDLKTENGHYNLLISKKGYQSLRVLNYYSIADQFSHVKVILVRGNGVVEYVLPEPERK